MRVTRTVRLSDEERDRIRGAAQRDGLGWTTFMRQAALKAARERLAERRPTGQQTAHRPENPTRQVDEEGDQ